MTSHSKKSVVACILLALYRFVLLRENLRKPRQGIYRATLQKRQARACCLFAFFYVRHLIFALFYVKI